MHLKWCLLHLITLATILLPLKTHILSPHIRVKKKSHYFYLIYGDKHPVVATPCTEKCVNIEHMVLQYMPVNLVEKRKF